MNGPGGCTEKRGGKERGMTLKWSCVRQAILHKNIAKQLIWITPLWKLPDGKKPKGTY